jgi:hypothetical protein
VLSLFCFVREYAIALIAFRILRKDRFFREARRNCGRAKIVKNKIAGLRGSEIAYKQLIDPPCDWIVKPAKVEIIPAPSPPPSECGCDYFCREGF